ncbi:unnamed protein product [Lathyrus oleraceus]
MVWVSTIKEEIVPPIFEEEPVFSYSAVELVGENCFQPITRPKKSSIDIPARSLKMKCMFGLNISLAKS